MNDQTDNLKNLWQKARNDTYGQVTDTTHIVRMAKQQIRRSVHLQLRTILILGITLAGIVTFFKYVAKLEQTISHIGTALMVGGLALRIFIEFISIYLSNSIDLTETASRSNNASLVYFRFRRRINGPVTISIVVLYTIGFYMLTPEFSLYFSTPAMIMMDLSYILVAGIFTSFIRITIKKEKKISIELLRIQEDIGGN
jgi:cation transport ATPase